MDIFSYMPGCVMVVSGGTPKVIVAPTDNFDLDGLVFPKKGIYFFTQGGYVTVVSLTIPNYTGFTTTTTVLKKLDEKYMPILTSPSGKKFKITVDDSGTLSATEVTE